MKNKPSDSTGKLLRNSPSAIESLENRIAPAVTIAISDGVTSVTPDTATTYTISYGNDGAVAANDVEISDTLPVGMTFDPALNPAWSIKDNVATLMVGDLAAGAANTATLILSAAPVAPAGIDVLVNTATITQAGPTPFTASATDTDALDAVPDLRVTKTDETASAAADDLLTYTITYTNAGNQNATGVFLTEEVPTGTSFSAADSTPGWTETVAGSGIYQFTIGPLAGGGTAGAAKFAVTVDADLPSTQSTIVNTVSIANDGSNGGDPTAGNNTATDTDAIGVRGPDLVLTKTDGVTTATPGGSLAYVLNYQNAGEVAASGVVITDTLPVGTTFNPTLNPGWVVNGPTVTFNLGSLAAAASGSVPLVLNVSAPVATGQDTIVNIASIADDGLNGADASPGNNTATDSDALIVAGTTDLVLVQGDSVTTAIPGSTLTYTLGYSNVGDTAAATVTITDTLPAGTSFDPALNPGWTLNGAALAFPIGVLPAGASDTVTLVLTVAANAPAGLESIFNTATITDNGAAGADPTPLNNTATDTDVLVAAPDLTLTKTDGVANASPGGVLIYTLSYTNSGNQNAGGVVITERLPAGTTFNAAASTLGWTESSPGVFSFNVGTVAAGANGSALFAVSVINPPAAGLTSIVNSASIADDGSNGTDPTTANNAATDTNALNTATGAPDLGVVKTASPYAATRNGLLTYSLAYSNTGDRAAAGVFLTETLPANTTFVSSGSSAGWTETTSGSGIYRFDVGSLAGAASGTVTFQVRVASTLPATLLNFSNTASIADDGANGADVAVANNSSTLTTPVYKGIYVAALGRSDSRENTVANAGSQVKVYDVATGAVHLDFMAYEANAKRGVHVAVGDFNADGFDDIVTAYGSAGGRVRVFDGLTGSRLSIGGLTELNPFGGGENFGAFVAAGDVTGDGRPDIIAGEAGGGDRVIVYNGATGQAVTTFRPFGQIGTGIRVAVGDTNGDGRADVITSHRTGSGEVKVFSGTSLPSGFGSNPLLDFDTGIASGAHVGAGNVSGDTRAEILIGGGEGAPGSIDIHAGSNGVRLRSADVYGTGAEFGVRVAAIDVNLDGIAEIIAGPGLGGNGEIRFVNGKNGTELKQYRLRPFEIFSQVAVRVAGTTTLPSAVSATT